MYLSGLSVGLKTKGSPVQFPVKAHVWVAGQVPSGGAGEATTHWYFFPSLSPSFPLCLKINKNLLNFLSKKRGWDTESLDYMVGGKLVAEWLLRKSLLRQSPALFLQWSDGWGAECPCCKALCKYGSECICHHFPFVVSHNQVLLSKTARACS